jgi:ParB family transcriptional regulator, chromosome partitioning protein
MGKLDELRRTTIGNVDESMGVGRVAVHGAPPPGPRPIPGRMQGLVRSKDAAEIAVDRIAPDPAQPREDFDREALERLAESLRTRGQLQPIRVRWDEDRGMYIIIAGERRWRAAGMAGLASMSCVIADAPATEGELLALQLVENALREDLRPLEQAKAYRTLIERNGWSARQVARELAIDHTNVVRALALLDLPETVQARVEQGTLPPATAYEVSKISDPAEQAELAARVVDENLSRADVVEAVRAHANSASAKAKGRGGKVARRPPKPRVFRTPVGKITAEMKVAGPEALVSALRDALTQVETELSAGDQAAA